MSLRASLPRHLLLFFMKRLVRSVKSEHPTKLSCRASLPRTQIRGPGIFFYFNEKPTASE